jgi:hypothetical protein
MYARPEKILEYVFYARSYKQDCSFQGNGGVIYLSLNLDAK